MNIIITGASRGLGFAIAERFAEAGNNLYLTSQNEVSLYKALAALSAKYSDQIIKAKPFDLGDKESVLGFGQWVIDTAGSVDILVNNAGQFLPGNISDEADGALERMMEVNLYSAYHLTRKLLPKMMEQKKGHIFNMCSTASLEAYSGGGAYSISKFALAGFSKNLREELKPHGIKVTSLYPGAVYTDSWAGSGVDPKRIMEPRDIAELIYTATRLSPEATVEEIILRPQKGDL